MKPLALTPGEPAGIGPEIALKAAMQPLPRSIIAIADPALLAARAEMMGLPVRLAPAEAAVEQHQPGVLPVLAVPFAQHDCLGKPSTENAAALLSTLDIAVAGCQDGRFGALVTGPLHKSVIADAGYAFLGHTEYLAERCQAALPVMLLANETMRVALATTHMPLRAVADAIDQDMLTATLDVVFDALTQRFGIPDPSIAVCGLNPHAGEGRHLGDEDEDIIRPAIVHQQSLGRRVSGPHPADTVFNHAGKDADCILAMFHDQGLPVIKFAGFGDIVNITLGLPIIRTSVDHGSALDIAGSGVASETSLLAAIHAAASLAAHQDAD
ncbi:MAG: 4-hydroxythreonine-4-phosphate dehydrogenase PdxA [Pseudomonadota bacterium]